MMKLLPLLVVLGAVAVAADDVFSVQKVEDDITTEGQVVT
jgi:hypothetical protein